MRSSTERISVTRIPKLSAITTTSPRENERVIDKKIDRLTGKPIQFDNRSRTQFKDFPDCSDGAAQFRLDLQIGVQDKFKVGLIEALFLII